MTELHSGEKQAPVVFVDITGMRKPGTHGGLAEYVVRLWDARTLAFHEARTSVLGGQKRNKLGSLWLILTPLFNGLVYYIIFGFVFQASKGVENYLGFLLVGIFMFQLTSGSITSSADSIYTGRKLVGANSLPVALLPLINNVKVWLSGIPSYLVMLLIIIAVPPVEAISWLSLLLFPLLALQALLMVGMSMIAAHFVARIHDLKNLLTIGMRGWLYASGVMFSVNRLTDAHPIFEPLVRWNPMAQVLEIARSILLYGTVPDIQAWLIVAVWALGAIIIGLLLIWKAEGTYELDNS